MELLESALAFAVVMIVLSTIVTGIVEALLRFFGVRQKTLRATIESLFDKIVWPRLEARLKQQAASRKTAGTDGAASDVETSARSDFVNGMTFNPAAGSSDRLLSHQKRIDVLSVVAFAERLGRTDVGQAILAEGTAAVEPIIQDFTRSFERFSSAGREVFRKNAKQAAIAVGIVLAFAANIDAGRLFTTLTDNPDVRQSLIEQAGKAAEANQKAVATLQTLQDQIASNGLQDNQAEEIKTQIGEIKGGLEALASEGLPIGHSFYPYCTQGTVGDKACAASPDNATRVEKAVSWVLLTIVAGVLIGLGGPFWFRVFSGLSQVFQVLRAFRGGSQPEQAVPEKLPTTPAAEASAKPESVLDAFKVAADAQAQVIAQRGGQVGSGQANSPPAGGVPQT